MPNAVNDAPVIVAGTPTYRIARVSTDAAGVQGNGFSYSPVFSPDGSKVAFYSNASNLVTGDTNNNYDVFVKDLATGAVTRVSTSASGAQGNDYSYNPVFSPDGSKIAFQSNATNLVAGDTNGSNDVFVKDLATGVVTRVSTNASGTQENGDGANPVFSPDGSKIAFYSYATNLVAGDSNNNNDVFVKDLATGAVTRVSTDASGVQANGGSYTPVFSPDGSKVAFYSNASNLVAGDTNGTADVFVKDLATGAVTRLSTSVTGTEGNGSSYTPVFSPDGSKVAFYSNASNLVAGDTNGAADVFVKDLATGAVTRVSTDASGAQGNSNSYSPVFSPDGSKVAFYSDASNLVAGDTNGAGDVFVKDLATGAVTRVSTNASGAQGNGASTTPVFSSDGNRVAFQSYASNLVVGDTNGNYDVFVRDLAPTFLAGPAAAYTENAAPVGVVTTQVTVSDADNTTFNGGSLTAAVTAGSHTGDVLTLATSTTAGQGIEISGTTVRDNGTPVGTLSGSGTASLSVALNGAADAAVVEALAEAVQFASTSDDPTADTRTVTVTLVDGSGTANGGQDTGSFTQAVTVTPVNDAPTATVLAGPAAAYTENAAPVGVVTTQVTVSDADNTTFNGGSLTAAVTAGSHTGDVLTLATSTTAGQGIEISGTTVRDNGTPVGTLSGSGTASLSVALNGAADAAVVEALAEAVQFASTSDDPTADTRTVTVTLVDGSGTANGGQDTGSFTQAVTVTPVAPPGGDPGPAGPTPGDDNLTGTGGDDTIALGLGNDTFAGGAGADLVYGNQGNDLIYGNQDADVIYGGQGDDRAFGGQGDDRLYGNLGNDVLYGNMGNDIVYGNQGADIIYGNQGNDILYGGMGDDVLYGGQGDDTLVGGLGNNILVGGLGADRYVFGANPGALDLVLGFNQGEGDRLVLGGQTYTTGTAQNGDALLTLSGGGTIDLAGIKAEQVNASYFAA